jgi:hypothetical protein
MAATDDSVDRPDRPVYSCRKQRRIMRKVKPANPKDSAPSVGASDREPARRAARRLASELEREGTSVLERAQRLAQRTEPQARRIAGELVPLSFDEDPGEAMAVLEGLAADDDRTVRAAAVAACSRVARAHFERVADILTVWRDDASPHLRRAVTVAVARAAEPHRLERVPHLMRLMGPLLADTDPGVRRTVGPSTLGVLLGAYPEATFEALVEWSMTSDPQVLWNVAMAFTGAPAAPMAKRALIVLRKLALDDRRTVWRAAATAMWQLGRRRPDVVRPELDRWLDDDVRDKVAREALRYL